MWASGISDVRQEAAEPSGRLQASNIRPTDALSGDDDEGDEFNILEYSTSEINRTQCHQYKSLIEPTFHWHWSGLALSGLACLVWSMVMVFFILAWSDLVGGVVPPTPTTLWKHFEHFVWLRKHFGHFVWLCALPHIDCNDNSYSCNNNCCTDIHLKAWQHLTSKLVRCLMLHQAWQHPLILTESITKYKVKYYKILQSIDKYCRLLRVLQSNKDCYRSITK